MSIYGIFPLFLTVKKKLKSCIPRKDEKGYYQTVSLTAPGEVVNGETGKRFWKNVPLPKGRHWCRPPSELDKWDDEGKIEWSKNGNPRRKIYSYESKGKRLQDVWVDFKDPQRPSYPTEKNKELLDIIIKTSSNPHSIVLDCFMGSGGTLISSYNNNRRWIGMDNSIEAIKLFKENYKLLENNLWNTKKFKYIEL